ncbi:MlaD family protein [Nocardioides sp.]|uniref:MlaD family protein n=1 Tax=Nocardioides sp. TaxID=35761 RepID=UPI00321B9450
MGASSRKAAGRRQSIRVGFVTLTLVVLVVLFAITAQNGMPDYVPGVSRTEVKAAFSEAGSLREGDDVRIANVRAGFVDKIELVDGQPVVTMKLDGGRPVYRDASATIGARSALGQKFVELDPGTSSEGELETTIGVDRTTPTIELDEVLGALDPATRERLGQTLRATGRGVEGRGQDLSDGLQALPPMLDDLEQISEALTADDGQDVTAMLEAADVLATSLEDQRSDLAVLVRSMGSTLAAVETGDGAPLEATLKQAPGTLGRVRDALVSLDQPLARTGSAARVLGPGAVALGEATPSLRGFMRESIPSLRKVPGVSSEAKPAVDALTPLLSDARPVVDQLGDTLRRSQQPLTTIAPYASEVLLFFVNAQSALSQGDGAGRWLRFYPVLNPEIFLSSVPIRSPLTQRDPYPAPGEAKNHRTGQIGDLP